MHLLGSVGFTLSNPIKSNICEGLSNIYIYIVTPLGFTLYWCQYIIYDDTSSATNNLAKTSMGGKGI
jgi:hypothetical protein